MIVPFEHIMITVLNSSDLENVNVMCTLRNSLKSENCYILGVYFATLLDL